MGAKVHSGVVIQETKDLWSTVTQGTGLLMWQAELVSIAEIVVKVRLAQTRCCVWQAIHYANRMVFLRVPLDASRSIKEPPSGIEGESTSSNITNRSVTAHLSHACHR